MSTVLIVILAVVAIALIAFLVARVRSRRLIDTHRDRALESREAAARHEATAARAEADAREAAARHEARADQARAEADRARNVAAESEEELSRRTGGGGVGNGSTAETTGAGSERT
jgi:FtsZ-interacting cell division protein ZipA